MEITNLLILVENLPEKLKKCQKYWIFGVIFSVSESNYFDACFVDLQYFHQVVFFCDDVVVADYFHGVYQICGYEDCENWGFQAGQGFQGGFVDRLGVVVEFYCITQPTQIKIIRAVHQNLVTILQSDHPILQLELDVACPRKCRFRIFF